ncbi:hypothetical protein B5M09_011710, partial [Aphanomyces astaci]
MNMPWLHHAKAAATDFVRELWSTDGLLNYLTAKVRSLTPIQERIASDRSEVAHAVSSSLNAVRRVRLARSAFLIELVRTKDIRTNKVLSTSLETKAPIATPKASEVATAALGEHNDGHDQEDLGVAPTEVVDDDEGDVQHATTDEAD